jgi:hypothetical protein
LKQEKELLARLTNELEEARKGVYFGDAKSYMPVVVSLGNVPSIPSLFSGSSQALNEYMANTSNVAMQSSILSHIPYKPFGNN